MRRMRGGHLLVVLGALVLLSLALPEFAHAATAASTAPANVACTEYPGLTARMVGCIRSNINTASTAFFTQIYPYLQNAIAAVMTLAVILYGVMLSFGAVEKVGRDTYIVLMKLACVVALCNSSPWIVSTVTGIMDNAAMAVVSYVPTSGAADGPPTAAAATYTDFSEVQCLNILSAGAGDVQLQGIGVWLGVDCIIDTVIGIHVDPSTAPTYGAGQQWFNPHLEADGNKGMTRSLLYLFFGAMQSSVLGLMLAVIGFFFIYGTLVLIVRCMFIYIAGYMGVTFLAIISPLIIPMILFKETKQYFDKWAKMLVSLALQPVIMLVFLVFSLVALDLCVYDGHYSVYYNIAGEASKATTFDLNKYLTDMRHPTTGIAWTSAEPPCTDCVAILGANAKTIMNVKADNPKATPIASTDAAGITRGLKQAKCTDAAIAADSTLAAQCNFTYPLSLALHTINWKIMELAYNSTSGNTAIVPAQSGSPLADVIGLQISRNVLSSIFFCLMVVFIMNGILAVVPMIVGDLLGDLNQSPILGNVGAGGQGGASPGKSLTNLVKNAMSKTVGNPMGMLGGKK